MRMSTLDIMSDAVSDVDEGEEQSSDSTHLAAFLVLETWRNTPDL